MTSKYLPPAHSEFTELSVPPTQSLAPNPQNSNSPHSSSVKSHQNSSPSTSSAPLPQSSIPSEDILGQKVTVVDKDDDPDTILTQSVPLYAVPERLKTKVRNCENIHLYSCLLYTSDAADE